MLLLFISGLNKSERAMALKKITLEKLPEDNYVVLKFLVNFLSKVSFYLLKYSSF